MKALHVLLAGSLTLNAVLLAFLLTRRAGPSSDSIGPIDGSGSPAALESRSGKSTGNPAALTGAALLSLEPRALQQALQRQNLPPEVVEALVLARIHAQYDARRRELIREVMRRPWWEVVASDLGRMSLLTPEQRQELRDLAAAACTAVLQHLGPQALDRDGAIAARHSFVEPQRAVLIDALLRDYADLDAALKEETRGIRTTADREREKFLAAERERDLAALLNPAEREIFELRTSPAVEPIRTRLMAFDPTEDEYRAVFAVHQEFNEKNPNTISADGSTLRRQLTADRYPEYEQKIRDALGEERYADWVLSGQRYTQTLVQLAPELGLTTAGVKETAQLLRATSERSWAIAEDKGLNPQQKLSALTDLAARARSELAAKLGPAGSEAIWRDIRWLDAIASGTAIQVDGGTIRFRPVNRAPIAPRSPPRATSGAATGG